MTSADDGPHPYYTEELLDGLKERGVDKAGEKEIILMHDYCDTSVTAALNVVDELLKEGYVFVTVEEILFE